MSTTKTRLRAERGVELWRTALTVSGAPVDEGYTVKMPAKTTEVWTFDQQADADAKFEELVLTGAG